jgi:UDP-N-acetylmuramate--alanine ligase
MNPTNFFPHTMQHPIHFVGIGGIGMSGIAEVMHNLGYRVSGSDLSENQNTTRLSNLGVTVHIGHDEKYIQGALAVVISSAVKMDNPEVLAAMDARIPVIQRAEMLAELMRLKQSVAISGTHGKTTTTSLMACLFETAGLDPTIVNGGILNAYNTNAHVGNSDWIVVEADESDGSFTKLHPTIAVITNIDPEHMEYYGTFENLKNAFIQFVHNIPFYGVAALCADHPVVLELSKTITGRRLITYGFSEEAMVRAVNVKPGPLGVTFDVELSQDLHRCLKPHATNVVHLPRRITNLKLPMMGLHNVQNALTLVVVAQELGLSDEVIQNTFNNFKGVRRRFTYVGTSKGITVIDDYAHHPVEIQTVIKAARQACPNGNVIAVVQPHRYTRLNALFDDFAAAFDGCHNVVVAPVYSAGEPLIEGADSIHLANAIRKNGRHAVYDLNDQKELPYLIRRLAQPGDMVLMMGAGSITYWAAALPGQLDALLDHDTLDVDFSNNDAVLNSKTAIH